MKLTFFIYILVSNLVVGDEILDPSPVKKIDSEELFPTLLAVTSDADSNPKEGKSYNFLRKNPDDADITSGDSCASFASCEECTTASSWCHWCGHDQSCHTRGSYYGCAWGQSCSTPAPSPPKNDTSGCSSHTNCRDCALASHLCHWCGHDNACHAIGSYYGCAVGVDCYSNDRCQRKESEPFHQKFKFPENSMGPLPMIILAVIVSILLCCFTTCFCVASGLKGAYDDLAGIAAQTNEPNEGMDEPLLLEQVIEIPTPQDVTTGDEAPAEDAEAPEENDGDDVEEEPAATEREPLLQTEDYQVPTVSRTVVTSRRRQPRHMQRLYNACAFSYFLSIVGVLSFAAFSYIYFPIKPTYNICNDDLAWRSIIDSLASLKVGAEFEILASVANPNRIDVVLDSGSGSFRHDGVPVGTFRIPPVVVKAQAITDILVIATLSPEKWEALSLTAEYYRGKLVLSVDTAATIRVPALFDYQFSAELKNIVVNVNEMSDRSLCACPSWKDNVTASSVLLP